MYNLNTRNRVILKLNIVNLWNQDLMILNDYTVSERSKNSSQINHYNENIPVKN